MRILLANPPCQIKLSDRRERYFVRAGSRWPFSNTKRREEPLDYIPFPFYLAYTSALLKKEDFDVYAHDGVAQNLTNKQFFDKVLEIDPDVVLFETSTPTINYDLEFVNAIKAKKPDLTIVLAGPHVTTFPKETLKENRQVDYILQQEYELAFLSLVKALRGSQAIEKIPGLCFRRDNEVVCNQPELIDPLDQLPFPDRDIFPSNEKPDLDLYWDGFCQHRPAVQMHASRGCPFRCNFCLWNQVMYDSGKYRCFSAKRIVDEMKHVRDNYQAREIYFDDDTFTGNRQQVLAFCTELKKRQLDIKWSVMGDAMISDKTMIDAMANAGCIGMKFGVESGNKKILKHIQKPIKFDKLKQVARWCAIRHIKTHATFTFGLSGETKETMEQTLNLAKNLDVDSVQFSITTPFPGTRYYDELKADGRLKAKGWEDYDGASSSIVKFENLDRKTVVEFCKTASGKWLRHKIWDPSWMYRQIYNLNRMRQGQGWQAIGGRFKRFLELI
ncbi:B12-binding domain-containing radical SAM protein [Patescibacteria group bacterium]